MSERETLWLKAKGRRVKVIRWVQDNRWYFEFKFNLHLKDHLKQLEGTRFDWDNKWWHMPITQHNAWQLAYLNNENPYAPYDKEIVKAEGGRASLRSHQREIIQFALDRRRCIIAGEMGIGKTLSLIEVMERSGIKDWYWFGPKSALYSVILEFRQWKAKIWPAEFLTYEKFAAMVKKSEDCDMLSYPAMGIVCDESYRVKNPRSQRGRAIRYLADRMREVHGDACFIICMTGTPAPKSPLDWWHQCRIACPGYLIEGDKHKFDRRLAIYAEEVKSDGGHYLKLLGWKRGQGECEICGEGVEAHLVSDHVYTPAPDEVTNLYKRMRGLVGVWLKRDCLELPEKQYRAIKLEPTLDVISAADIIAKTTTRAAQALILLRELSDGFQYQEVETDKTKVCSSCKGSKRINDFDNSGILRSIDCPICSGLGIVPVYERQAIEVPCPKYEQLKLDLDAYSEIGRVVIYGGFHGTIDRCVATCLNEGWDIIRVDGKGFWSSNPKYSTPVEMLEAFADTEADNKIAFIGHPESGGAGLNLTASPVIIFVSNDFNGGNRRQAENRNHRLGTRGSMILDYIHLETDKIVLKNLLEKQELEAITLGDLQTALQSREARSL